MHADLLTDDEKGTLLRLARAALEQGARGKPLAPLDLDLLRPRLRADGASFVTLTADGALRGCIGSLEAFQPLAEDVREHAVAAACQDYRFPPVVERELIGIRIEVSRLSAPVLLEYVSPEDLCLKLRPHVDGVILRDGTLRATFLPQVWSKLPDPTAFLDSLCEKMRAAPDQWRRTHLDVLTYQVEEFHE